MGIVPDVGCTVLDFGSDYVDRSVEVVFLGTVLRVLGLGHVVLDY